MQRTDATGTKRKTFYVNTDIFEQGFSRMAVLVFTYLSRVANREGRCFPSVAKIAEQCGCCENTVRKAIRELCGAGILTSEPRYVTTHNGRVRQRANVYTLTAFLQREAPSARTDGEQPPSKNEPTPLQPLNPPPSTNEGEINNNSKHTIANTPSFLPERREPELERILLKLQLHLYEDRAFAAAVEHAIRRMYEADGVTVKKQRIPQGAVRNVLRMLTIDHIDYVQRQLERGTEPIVSGESYLISCIYNAPSDCAVIGARESNFL